MRCHRWRARPSAAIYALLRTVNLSVAPKPTDASFVVIRVVDAELRHVVHKFTSIFFVVGIPEGQYIARARVSQPRLGTFLAVLAGETEELEQVVV